MPTFTYDPETSGFENADARLFPYEWSIPTFDIYLGVMVAADLRGHETFADVGTGAKAHLLEMLEAIGHEGDLLGLEPHPDRPIPGEVPSMNRNQLTADLGDDIDDSFGDLADQPKKSKIVIYPDDARSMSSLPSGSVHRHSLIAVLNFIDQAERPYVYDEIRRTGTEDNRAIMVASSEDNRPIKRQIEVGVGKRIGEALGVNVNVPEPDNNGGTSEIFDQELPDHFTRVYAISYQGYILLNCPARISALTLAARLATKAYTLDDGSAVEVDEATYDRALFDTLYQDVFGKTRDLFRAEKVKRKMYVVSENPIRNIKQLMRQFPVAVEQLA